MRVNGVERVKLPAVPLMVNGYVPLGAFAPTTILMTENAFAPKGAGLGAGGTKVTVTSGGKPVTFSVTFSLNRPAEVIATVADFVSVRLIVSKFGETEMLKSLAAIVTLS